MFVRHASNGAKGTSGHRRHAKLTGRVRGKTDSVTEKGDDTQNVADLNAAHGKCERRLLFARRQPRVCIHQTLPRHSKHGGDAPKRFSGCNSVRAANGQRPAHYGLLGVSEKRVQSKKVLPLLPVLGCDGSNALACSDRVRAQLLRFGVETRVRTEIL